MFTFRFNLISTHDGLRRTYTLDENCSVALPWAYRELACESNYMEVRLSDWNKMFLALLLIVSLQVSLMTDVTCVNVTRSEDWDSAFDTVRAFFFFFLPQTKRNCRACSHLEICPGLFFSHP